jgi:hypothetical protein
MPLVRPFFLQCGTLCPPNNLIVFVSSREQVVPVALATVLGMARDDLLSTAVSSGLALLASLQTSSPELKASLEEVSVCPPNCCRFVLAHVPPPLATDGRGSDAQNGGSSGQ